MNVSIKLERRENWEDCVQGVRAPLAASRPQAFTRTHATCINKTNFPPSHFDSSQHFASTFTSQKINLSTLSQLLCPPRASSSRHFWSFVSRLAAALYFLPSSANDIGHHDALFPSRLPHWRCLHSLWSRSRSHSAATRHKLVSTLC